jgi:hypothetical protein
MTALSQVRWATVPMPSVRVNTKAVDKRRNRALSPVSVQVSGTRAETSNSGACQRACCHTRRVDDDYEARLNAKLSPDSVRQALVQVGALLCAYELLKLQIVDAVHDEYWRGNTKDDGTKIYLDDRYQAEVLARDPKSRYKASVAWLVEAGALSFDQAGVLGAIRDYRNEVAHELPRILIDPDYEIRTEVLLAAASCLRSLGVFWGRDAMAIDPRWDGVDVKDEDIWGGPDLLMSDLLRIAGLLDPDGRVRPI